MIFYVRCLTLGVPDVVRQIEEESSKQIEAQADRQPAADFPGGGKIDRLEDSLLFEFQRSIRLPPERGSGRHPGAVVVFGESQIEGDVPPAE